MQKFDVLIPFPAWDGIRNFSLVCAELRRNEQLADIPSYFLPRRITMRQKETPVGFDDCMVVELWFTNGFRAVLDLGGLEDSHYGTAWVPLRLKIEWRKVGGKGRLFLEGREINSLKEANEIRRSRKGKWDPSENAKIALEEALRDSEAIATKAAERVRKSFEEQQQKLAASRLEDVILPPFPLKYQ